MFPASNKLTDIKKAFVRQISGFYPKREAESIANMLIQHYFGLSRVEQQLQADKRLNESEMLLVWKAINRLLAEEPIQYILGSTIFYGLELKVSSGVLIPRPETEELVNIMVKHNQDDIDILDVGTGSGCIALALKSVFTHSRVTAIDISEKALSLARENAAHLRLAVDFIQCDILEPVACGNRLDRQFDIIVSNPPYVLRKEKEQMAGNVLKYEPHEALFVGDDDPLLFYRKIISLAEKALRSGGKLYFEINENQAEETAALLDNTLFGKPEIMTDFHGKKRFLFVRKS